MPTKWDEIHRKFYKDEIVTDDFLQKNIKYIKEVEGKILDLGCGTGNISKELVAYGKKVIAADNSIVALDIVEKNLGVETKYMDMTEKFPFENNFFDIVIADLSLHYFSEKVTFSILDEINRVLAPGGILLARVNSVKDVNHGAGSCHEIEKHFYNAMDMEKRFFDIQDVYYFFKKFIIIDVREEKMLRYINEKEVIEIIVKK